MKPQNSLQRKSVSAPNSGKLNGTMRHDEFAHTQTDHARRLLEGFGRRNHAATRVEELPTEAL